MNDQLRPRRTHLSNRVFHLPGGNEDNDLWVWQGLNTNHEPVICSTWVLTDDQRERIAKGENIELVVWGVQQPPVALHLNSDPIGKKPLEAPA